jgi:hypothetical protein
MLSGDYNIEFEQKTKRRKKMKAQWNEYHHWTKLIDRSTIASGCSKNHTTT